MSIAQIMKINTGKSLALRSLTWFSDGVTEDFTVNFGHGMPSITEKQQSPKLIFPFLSSEDAILTGYYGPD